MDKQTKLHRLREIRIKAIEYHDALQNWALVPADHPDEWYDDQRDVLEDTTLALARALEPAVKADDYQLAMALDWLLRSVGEHVGEFERGARPTVKRCRTAAEIRKDELGNVGTALNVLTRQVAELRREVPGGMRSATAGQCPHKRLLLDFEHRTVTLDDHQKIDVKPDQARLLRCLIEADGERMSGDTITEKECISRPDRVHKRLPSQIRVCIDTKSGGGGGYRLLVLGGVT